MGLTHSLLSHCIHLQSHISHLDALRQANHHRLLMKKSCETNAVNEFIVAMNESGVEILWQQRRSLLRSPTIDQCQHTAVTESIAEALQNELQASERMSESSVPAIHDEE